jgi:hypothetical protein
LSSASPVGSSSPGPAGKLSTPSAVPKSGSGVPSGSRPASTTSRSGVTVALTSVAPRIRSRWSGRTTTSVAYALLPTVGCKANEPSPAKLVSSEPSARRATTAIAVEPPGVSVEPTA